MQKWISLDLIQLFWDNWSLNVLYILRPCISSPALCTNSSPHFSHFYLMVFFHLLFEVFSSKRASSSLFCYFHLTHLIWTVSVGLLGSPTLQLLFSRKPLRLVVTGGSLNCLLCSMPAALLQATAQGFCRVEDGCWKRQDLFLPKTTDVRI